MFYFGLNEDGYISSHVFDRKISNKSGFPVSGASMPWLRAASTWEPRLVAGIPSYIESKETEQSSSDEPNCDFDESSILQ